MKQIFNPADLMNLARKHKKAYSSNDPFPHIVIDNFLPVDVAKGVLGAFPKPDDIVWDTWDSETEVKLGFSDDTKMNVDIRDVLLQFNSAAFMEFLEELTGIEGLIPDPYFWGGGMHQIQPGGFLNIHADFNYHPRMKLDRRINLLLYLNEHWKDEYNGHLELWNLDMTEARQRIAPVFNRCVIFSTTDFSYHGNPDPLACPPGMTRKSLALYYYSNGRPAEEISGEHSTLFRNRPGENARQKYSAMRRIRRTAMRFIPPIVVDAVVATRQRLKGNEQ